MPLTRKHFIRTSDQKLINRLHKIRVFRNGDRSYRGHLFKFRKTNYRDVPALLEALSKEMQDSIFLHIGGIRSLYTLDGHEVTSVDELIDGDGYVATCLSEPFKAILYPVQSRTVLSQASTTLIKSMSLSSLRRRPSGACSSISMEYRGPVAQTFRPRCITVVQGIGERPRKIFRLQLTNSNATHLQMVMEQINHLASFDQGKPLDRVFNEICVEIRSLEDFFGHFFIFFAFPKCRISWEMLDVDTIEDDIIGELNEVPRNEPLRYFPTSISSQYRTKNMDAEFSVTTVRECVERSTHRRFKLKISKRIKNNLLADSFTKTMLNEMNLLADFHHPNITSLFFIEETPIALFYIVEQCEGGDLQSAIANDNIDEDEYMPFMENLASALAYLHLRGIAHRDVCPANLFLRTASDQRKLVLANFDWATRIEDTLYDFAGFLLFMAPEMVSRKGYGLKADVWSAGMTLYVMVTKSMPFDYHDVDDCTRHILKQPVKYDDNEWEGVHKSVKALTDLMLCRDTVIRLSAAEVLEFIANVRNGIYHQYEFDRYCEVDMDAKRRRRRSSSQMTGRAY